MHTSQALHAKPFSAARPIHIREIDPRRTTDVRAFERVPFVLYADSPFWVPPVAGEVREALDPKRHPYYRHSEAAFFVAECEGRLAGRIGICHHRPYRTSQGNDAGYFNFLETADDPEV